ncbi:MAG: hypothetical protein A2Y12_14895 [Planctomycetes bacterium GWF2_42_9]|nr:MAG: hypothetical protein A2Y12_14895 [Planctomycetes bacterium GWF2_42_9]HAL45168.1 hypothetical protein [Phycisphaerales bacterium]
MSFIKYLLLVLILCGMTAFSLAAPPVPANAACRITCRVTEVVEWSEASFQDIDLGELNPRNKQAKGQSALVLYTNGDVIITADNSQNAQLTNGQYQIQTQYQLQLDNGVLPTQWFSYDSFLKDAIEIKHVENDGAVIVILAVKAEVKDVQPGSGGEYAATQTLTVCWKS